MSLVEFAQRELELAGLFDEDSVYGGMLGSAVLEIIEVFASQGHSGYSAALATALVNRLMCFENITPITDAEDNWMHVANDMAGRPDLWQCTRNPELFSNDGGKTYYRVSDDARTLIESVHIEPGA